MAQRAGERVEAARGAAGVSQDDVARDLGVTQQTVSNWETGQHRIPDKYRRRLAELIGVDLGTLQGWIASDEEQKNKRGQRELSETKRVFLDAVKPVERFVSQYEELGHTYRRLDETTDKILVVLEELTNQMGDLVSQQAEMLSQQAEMLRLIRDQGGGRRAR